MWCRLPSGDLLVDSRDSTRPSGLPSGAERVDAVVLGSDVVVVHSAVIFSVILFTVTVEGRMRHSSASSLIEPPLRPAGSTLFPLGEALGSPRATTHFPVVTPPFSLLNPLYVPHSSPGCLPFNLRRVPLTLPTFPYVSTSRLYYAPIEFVRYRFSPFQRYFRRNWIAI